VKSGDIRDLAGTREREKLEIGVFITLEEPSRDMVTEAVTAGFYNTHWGQHPRIQILTIADLLEDARIDMPPQSQVSTTVKRAPRIKSTPAATQASLLDGVADTPVVAERRKATR